MNMIDNDRDLLIHDVDCMIMCDDMVDLTVATNRAIRHILRILALKTNEITNGRMGEGND